METKWLKISAGHMDTEGLEEAGRIIKKGGLVAFPTETVYGLGGDALNPIKPTFIEYVARGNLRFQSRGERAFLLSKFFR